MKKALITGIRGQDGAYLAELLLSKGYEVYGADRRSSSYGYNRLDILGITDKIKNVYIDLLDVNNINTIIREIKPDELYNLAAQSFVGASFRMPLVTSDVDGMGVLRILDAIKTYSPHTRFYQASTSEMYGGMDYNRPKQGYNEESEFHPRSPYGVAKLFGHRMTKNYRESFGLYACSGILFNHESPLRGLEFVTRKITNTVAKIFLGLQEKIYLGNLDALRDRGHAKDYVKAMWLMLQQNNPQDYVIATGKAYSVKDFVNWSFEQVGISIEWKGNGIDEKGYDQKTGSCLVEIDPQYFRPAEVDYLLGDSSKARTELGWATEYTVQQMCKEMVASDIESLNK